MERNRINYLYYLSGAFAHVLLFTHIHIVLYAVAIIMASLHRLSWFRNSLLLNNINLLAVMLQFRIPACLTFTFGNDHMCHILIYFLVVLIFCCFILSNIEILCRMKPLNITQFPWCQLNGILITVIEWHKLQKMI